MSGAMGSTQSSPMEYVAKLSSTSEMPVQMSVAVSSSSSTAAGQPSFFLEILEMEAKFM